jgi:hypothetical protein
MTATNVKPFRGQVPRISDRLIGPNFAKKALNCKITAGRLDPVRGLGLMHTSLAESVATMYRYRHNGVDNWLVSSKVVDYVKSPTAQDALGRVYWTGDGEPRMSTSELAISGPGPYPNAFYVLGVTPPTTAAALIVTGGGAPVEIRAYVYTFRTVFGEESAPSPAVFLSGNINGSWDLSALQVAPPNSGTISAAATVATDVVEVTLDTVRGLQPYEEVVFAGVTGMTDLNGKHALLEVDAGTNKVKVALSTAQVYAGGADTWARVAPHNIAGMTKVIYRTVGTNTDYKRVAEIPVANTTYSDTIASTALGEAIPTLDSFTPPKNLHSAVALANGSISGIAGNQLCFSEQYKPYSWPIGNRYAFAGTGVATCATGNSVILLTDGKPIVATATVPEAVSMASLPTEAPCVSKLSAKDVGGACVYASNDGLYLASPTGVRNLTNDLFRKDEWVLIRPETFNAAFFDQKYFAMHDAAGDSSPKIMCLDLAEPDSIVEIDEQVDALYRNPVEGGYLYMSKGNRIYQWDLDDANRYLVFWSSRQYQFGSPINLTVAQVHADYSQIAPPNTAIADANAALLADADDINGAMCSAPLNTYPLNGSALRPVPDSTALQVQFSLRVDGQVVFTKQVRSSKPFRLPTGFKSEVQGFEIAASIPVHSVSMAQSERELGQVSV